MSICPECGGEAGDIPELKTVREATDVMGKPLDVSIKLMKISVRKKCGCLHDLVPEPKEGE